MSASWVVLTSAFWIATAGNAALWQRLESLGLLESAQGARFALAMAIIIWGALTVLLGLFAWRATLKPVAALLLVATAIGSHFMLAYGVVIDPGMITNAVQTDIGEVSALTGWHLASTVTVLALVPGWLLWRQPVDHGSGRRQFGRSLVLVVSGAAMVMAAVLLSFQSLASVMRNHKDVRYLINPLAALYSAGRVAAQPWQRDDSVLVRIGEDARLFHGSAVRQRTPILLLVLGETARSGNFAINGYRRPTTPEIEREGVVSFRNAWSCGTSTAASVPCMFSNLTREHFESRKNRHEGLMDVLQHAGLAVLWIDNQSGCKGVCDRVQSVNTSTSKTSPFCSSGACLDEVMLEGLDERIAQLDPRRVARGLVIVMHQMGSHGPVYHLRSPADRKRFMPECTSADLQDCTRDTVINAYDNSIAYTDHFLAQAIDWLKRRQADADTGMLYVADHGESLGENNLYLHGLPYSFAPDVQKHVPWITWMSDGLRASNGLSASCLYAARDRPISHDNYFHSVLGLLGVETRAYRPSLDAYAACRDGAMRHTGEATQSTQAPPRTAQRLRPEPSSPLRRKYAGT